MSIFFCFCVLYIIEIYFTQIFTNGNTNPTYLFLVERFFTHGIIHTNAFMKESQE